MFFYQLTFLFLIDVLLCLCPLIQGVREHDMPYSYLEDIALFKRSQSHERVSLHNYYDNKIAIFHPSLYHIYSMIFQNIGLAILESEKEKYQCLRLYWLLKMTHLMDSFCPNLPIRHIFIHKFVTNQLKFVNLANESKMYRISEIKELLNQFEEQDYDFIQKLPSVIIKDDLLISYYPILSTTLDKVMPENYKEIDIDFINTQSKNYFWRSVNMCEAELRQCIAR